MNLKKVICIFFLLCFAKPYFGQENGTGPKEKSIQSERKLRKQLRFEAKERRKKERAEKKAVKAYHKRLQTKKVRKRMKQSKNKATLRNENKREFFLIRWFKKKKRV